MKDQLAGFIFVDNIKEDEIIAILTAKSQNRFLINHDFHKFMIKSKEFKLFSYVLQYMSTNVKVNESPNHFMTLDAVARGINDINKIAKVTKLHE